MRVYLPATRQTVIRLRVSGHGFIACCHDTGAAMALLERNDWCGSVTPSREYPREWCLSTAAPTHRINKRGELKRLK